MLSVWGFFCSVLFCSFVCWFGMGRREKVKENGLGSSWLLHYVSERAHPSGIELTTAHRHCIISLFQAKQLISKIQTDFWLNGMRQYANERKWCPFAWVVFHGQEFYGLGSAALESSQDPLFICPYLFVIRQLHSCRYGVCLLQDTLPGVQCAQLWKGCVASSSTCL